MSTTGSCLCGNIKFSISDINLRAYHCHCKICQKASGGIFSTFINLKVDQVTWVRGKPSFYNSSKEARRGFCNNCGTSICYEVNGGERLDINVGSLDNIEQLKLVGHNGVESRPNNFTWKDNLPKFRTDD